MLTALPSRIETRNTNCKRYTNRYRVRSAFSALSSPRHANTFRLHKNSADENFGKRHAQKKKHCPKRESPFDSACNGAERGRHSRKLMGSLAERHFHSSHMACEEMQCGTKEMCSTLDCVRVRPLAPGVRCSFDGEKGKTESGPSIRIQHEE